MKGLHCASPSRAVQAIRYTYSPVTCMRGKHWLLPNMKNVCAWLTFLWALYVVFYVTSSGERVRGNPSSIGSLGRAWYNLELRLAVPRDLTDKWFLLIRSPKTEIQHIKHFRHTLILTQKERRKTNWRTK